MPDDLVTLAEKLADEERAYIREQVDEARERLAELERVLDRLAVILEDAGAPC
jgi:5-bromo-4-chloroindolyl phosphate hydrolysis protein